MYERRWFNMSIEELKEAYINKNENAENETRGWSLSLFGVNINGDTFWSIGIDYMYELIKLLGNKEVYDKFNIEQIENLLENENFIQKLLDTTNNSEYTKLKEILTLKDSVKKMLYDYIKSKLLQIKLEQSKNNLNKKKNIVKMDYINNKYVISKINNNDIIKINMFGKEKELAVFSTGDNRFDESRSYKDYDFELSNEEIDMLNWFINNIKIEDYKKEIVDYCNEEYSGWQYSDGTQEGPIGIDDIEDEINITAIAINIIKNGNENNPEISFYGECNCDEDHGICIGFRNKKFLGIASQDWTL